VVINYAAGQPMVDAMYPGNSYIDIIGWDCYDMWMPTPSGNIRTDGEWASFLTSTTGDGSPMGFEAFATYAASKGKPFVVPEWGLSASTQYEYDNPFFIQKLYDWFKTKAPVDKDNPAAGKLAGEAYFNTWAQTQLWPTTTKPLSAAKYQSLKWGSTL
jgi:beta-mannanase